MTLSTLAAGMARWLALARDIARLPRADLQFHSRLHPQQIQASHAAFTKPHPRYRVIKNKSIGIALIDLRRFKATADYLDTVKKKDFAAQHARRARARGYVVHEIDRNNYVEDIYQINISAESRQGRTMDQPYLVREAAFTDYPHCRYFGVLNNKGKLMGYCNVQILGNFAATDKLLGYKNSDGLMYLLLLEITCRLIEEGKVNFLMYDTYLGAQPGLRNFKRKLGFLPYRIRYSKR